MTLPEALLAAAHGGLVPELDSAGTLILTTDGRRPDPAAKAVLLAHRDRLQAILQLREIHAAMGLSPEDVAFVEQALLSGRISGITIVSRPPEGPPA